MIKRSYLEPRLPNPIGVDGDQSLLLRINRPGYIARLPLQIGKETEIQTMQPSTSPSWLE